jgi:hypothetical protein
MQVNFDTRPGFADRPNEDFVAASRDIVVVLDGLTSPPQLGTGCLHGTPWYVSQLGTRLLAGAVDTDLDLRTVLTDAIRQVAALHSGSCDLSHTGTPSCSVALLRCTETRIDHLSVFDSVIVLDGPAGLSVISDDRVNGYARAEHDVTTTHRIGTPEHASAVAALVAAQRPHRNRTGGYWTAAAISETADNAVIGRADPRDVAQAAVMTDGVACLVDTYHQTDWAGLMTLLATRGPAEVIDHVRRVEDTDSDGARWPRYKRSDDATVAHCRIG